MLLRLLSRPCATGPHVAHAAAAQQLDQAVATERRPVRSGLPWHGQDARDSLSLEPDRPSPRLN